MELLKVVSQILELCFFHSFSYFSRLRSPPPPCPVRYCTGQLLLIDRISCEKIKNTCENKPEASQIIMLILNMIDQQLHAVCTEITLNLATSKAENTIQISHNHGNDFTSKIVKES